MKLGGALPTPGSDASAVPVPIWVFRAQLDTALVLILQLGNSLALSLKPRFRRTTIELLALGRLPLIRLPVNESNVTPTPRGFFAVPAMGGLSWVCAGRGAMLSHLILALQPRRQPGGQV